MFTFVRSLNSCTFSDHCVAQSIVTPLLCPEHMHEWLLFLLCVCIQSAL